LKGCESKKGDTGRETLKGRVGKKRRDARLIMLRMRIIYNIQYDTIYIEIVRDWLWVDSWTQNQTGASKG